MLIVLNIDRRLLGELLVEAARARGKPKPGRGRRAAAGKAPARPARGPAVTGEGKVRHVRVAR
ncbi:MAG: hypothetical protein OYH76_20510 [Defluviicoccus sp.]|nr:hypothetical protein [Defluviicoccus sp.]MDE0278287.1 hypothetical protein [Defluviicoccus sp.]